jgi:hypothetical protein
MFKCFTFSCSKTVMMRESCRSFLVWLVAATDVGSSAVEGRGKAISINQSLASPTWRNVSST